MNSDKDNEAAYYVELDLGMGRLTFDRWPRKRGDYPFMPETERKVCALWGQKYRMDVIREGSVLEVYFDGKYAMSARMEEFLEGTFGFASSFGEVLVADLEYLSLDR